MFESFSPLRPVFLPDPLDRHHPLARGLAAWWLVLPGLDGGRQWFDLYGLNHGTLTSMTTSASGWRGTPRPGGFGHLLFDGSNDLVSVPDAPGIVQTGAVSVAFWFLASTLPGAGQYWFFDKESGTGWSGATPVIFLNGSNNKLDFRRGNSVNAEAALGNNTAFSAGQPYHVLCTCTAAGAATIYVNGLADGSGSIAAAYADGGQPLKIGSRNGSSVLNGWMDDIRLYSRSFNAAEAWGLYENSFQGCPGLLRRQTRGLAYDPIAYDETGRALTLRAVLGETDARALTETGLVATLRAVLGETDGAAWGEAGRAQAVLALLGRSDAFAINEAGALVVRALLGEVDGLAASQAGALALRALLGETDDLAHVVRTQERRHRPVSDRRSRLDTVER